MQKTNYHQMLAQRLVKYLNEMYGKSLYSIEYIKEEEAYDYDMPLIFKRNKEIVCYLCNNNYESDKKAVFFGNSFDNIEDSCKSMLNDFIHRQKSGWAKLEEIKSISELDLKLSIRGY